MRSFSRRYQTRCKTTASTWDAPALETDLLQTIQSQSTQPQMVIFFSSDDSALDVMKGIWLIWFAWSMCLTSWKDMTEASSKVASWENVGDKTVRALDSKA